MNTCHALIIDDNVKNVTVLAQLLADQQVTSTPITNPKLLDSVLDMAGPLNVVFVDLEMPGLNGYDVLAKLKSYTELENVPVVAYTVHVSEINVAYERGFDSFLAKPIDPDKFPDQLARVLRREPVWETA